MPSINVTLNIQVEGGPQVPVAPIKVPIEAYDPITVPPLETGSTAEVEVQPGNKVSFLLIQSNVYTPSSVTDVTKQLTYEPDGKAPINLGSPQLYLGMSSIATLLGDVKKITFTNNLKGDEGKKAAVIEILVGRMAASVTPPTSAAGAGGAG